MARVSYVHWHGAACSLMQREQSLSFDVRGLVLTANATRLQKQVAWFFATKASLSSFPGAAENGGDSNHEVENSDVAAEREKLKGMPRYAAKEFLQKQKTWDAKLLNKIEEHINSEIERASREQTSEIPKRR